MMKHTPLAVFKETEDITSKQLEDFPVVKLGKSLRLRNHSLAQDISSRIKSRDVFFSLEFLPPRTHFGEINLLDRLQFMQDGGPLFCSVTWHSTGSDSGCGKETPSSRLAASMAGSFDFHTMLHLAANDFTQDQVMSVLQQAQLNGIRTILALRGDRNPGWKCPKNGFLHAVDLLRFIREKFGDIFTVGVAGYPSGHHEADSYDHDMKFLKEKVDAGADFVISQIFYSSADFMKFFNDCQVFGINVPVIPGVLPILSYSSFMRIATLCHLDIPWEISNCLSQIKHNEKAITNYGIHFAVTLARDILQTRRVPAVHFYTLNREKAIVRICRQLGLWPNEPIRYRICLKYFGKEDSENRSNFYLGKNGCSIIQKVSTREDLME